MEQISLYLAKFAGIVPKERLVREGVAEILMRRIGAPISLETIHFRRNTIFIDASPSIKNILFMYKEDILKELQEKLSQVSVRDVR